MTTILRMGYLLRSMSLSVSFFIRVSGISVTLPSNVISVDQVTARVSLSQLNLA
jgi:hypothetical protein